MPDFSFRSTEPEMMDDFSLGSQTIDPIMDELEVINKLLGGHRVFFDALRQLNLRDGWTISDWGCGGGDSLRVLEKWSRSRSLDLNFVGVDATAAAVKYAENKTKDWPQISYIHADVMSADLKPEQFDIVISSLFTHHFLAGDWKKLVLKMLSCSKRAVIINDLHRHWLAYHSIGILTKLFSRSRFVKHDSQLSVLRGFTRRELEHLLKEAGIHDYRLRWKWAFRWQLIIFKPDNG